MNNSIEPTFEETRALVVDDDDDSCSLLMAVLESYGIEVYAVLSVNAALDAFVRLKPNIVISDIIMPEEDGYSLLRRIKELEVQQGNPTPVIAVTCLSEEKEILSQGFDCVLQKPVDADVLIRQIASLIENNNVRQTN